MMARILLVEDDDDLRDVLRLTLELEGFAVDEARDGIDALVRLAYGGRPDAVVLNLGLPVLTGWEVLEQLEQAPVLAGIPVVVVTGSRIREGERPRVAGVVTKPFDSESLVALLRKVTAGAGEAARGAPA